MDKIQELRKKLIGSAKKKVQEKYEEKDVHIIKAVNILDDLDSITNLLTEQLIEWHSTHFPELNNLVNGEKYCELIYKLGEKEKFETKAVKEIIEDEELAKTIVGTAKKSMGSKADKESIAEMQTLALNCSNLEQERTYLASFVEKNMKKEMPNFTEIAGAIIGAKIMAQAGGKKKVAFLPASAIQVIGAEKALFLHFRKGIKGPKYGYLFQHPLVKAAKKENKGRLARSLAAKLAIAARKDYFGNTSNAKDLGNKLAERARELKEKQHPEEKGQPSPQKFENTRRAEKAREMNQRERSFGKREFGNRTENRSFGNRKDDREFGRKPFRKNDDKPKYEPRKNDRTHKEKEFRSFGRKPLKKKDDQTSKPRERKSYMDDLKKGPKSKPDYEHRKSDEPHKEFGTTHVKKKRSGKSKKEFTHWKKNRKK